VIGADVGMGIRGGVKGRKDGDPSVAQILDSQMRQVAVWRGLCHPDVFAKILVTLGYHYNSAMIAPERNNHGLVTCVALRDMDYPYLYTDQVEGTLEPDKDTINLGFFTSERSHQAADHRQAPRARPRAQIEINDTTTLKEMLTFVVNENGKMEAEGGTHDDHSHGAIATSRATYNAPRGSASANWKSSCGRHHRRRFSHSSKQFNHSRTGILCHRNGDNPEAKAIAILNYGWRSQLLDEEILAKVSAKSTN
jgi:hypothetical protein